MASTSITVYTGMGPSNNTKEEVIYAEKDVKGRMRKQPQPKSYIHRHSSCDLSEYGCTICQQYYWYDILDHIIIISYDILQIYDIVNTVPKKEKERKSSVVRE